MSFFSFFTGPSQRDRVLAGRSAAIKMRYPDYEIPSAARCSVSPTDSYFALGVVTVVTDVNQGLKEYIRGEAYYPLEFEILKKTPSFQAKYYDFLHPELIPNESLTKCEVG